MWLPGHLALSFLISLPIILFSVRRGVNRTLVLSYAAFFAIYPDFFHIGYIRMISHSPIGLGILVAVAVIVLWFIFRIDRWLVVIAIVAAFGHLMGDWVFGHFYPAFPFSEEVLSMNKFNTPLDIQTEVVLSAVATAIFIPLFPPSGTAKAFLQLGSRDRWQVMILAAMFLSMIVLQGILFLQMDVLPYASQSDILLLLGFIVPLLFVLIPLVMARISLNRSARM